MWIDYGNASLSLFLHYSLYSTNIVTAKEILYKLLQERRVLLIMILASVDLYIAFHIKNFDLWSITSFLNVLAFISMDLAIYFPPRASIIIILTLLVTYIISLVRVTFLRKDCDEKSYHGDYMVSKSAIAPSVVSIRKHCFHRFSQQPLHH